MKKTLITLSLGFVIFTSSPLLVSCQKSKIPNYQLGTLKVLKKYQTGMSINLVSNLLLQIIIGSKNHQKFLNNEAQRFFYNLEANIKKAYDKTFDHVHLKIDFIYEIAHQTLTYSYDKTTHHDNLPMSSTTMYALEKFQTVKINFCYINDQHLLTELDYFYKTNVWFKLTTK
ncbi:hypothetical protein [Spiroplasma endosymbiont of Crioceris asparagi]|uniref:hypothetical protein n=1 Tax=Spiroplasma endosymbiont of Crioceris asparagi TaxID=3066286 RepID=UPI0030CEF3DC